MMHLDVSRSWPPVIACSFTEQLTCVTFQGSSSVSAPAQSSDDHPAPSRPKGVVIYANSNVPVQVCPASQCMAVVCMCVHACMYIYGVLSCCISFLAQAPSFYWELEVSHLGEGSTDLAMGYSPDPPIPQESDQGQPWIYPRHTVLIRK